ncbi:hypothetical protein SAMN05444274_10770 [Mariniphaga anaerophila]|uniref:Uncharacterized protein n=1 Tax=Mariniphaga anaerophila TaxID=1484053 RepID=A0A1M5DEX8_9BACT|nr:hypothetical protein [Mariniphaga anaerophila]SHF65527.1 hypothetical protein SAMN05444274_10770 [Mariniphaga anaerophila]
MGLIEKYAYRRLYKKAASIDRRVKLPHPETVRKVGILWEPSENQAFQFLNDHFSRSQSIVRNICIYPNNATAEPGANVLTAKDLNWLGFPKPGLVDDFISAEFDLLLNLALTQTLPFDYITALSRACFKVGWSPKETNFFDLNINIEGKPEALYLARQQIFYLGQLNKTM